MAGHSTWSIEDDCRLRALWQRPKTSARKIAEKLGKTTAQVQSRRRTIGLKPRRAPYVYSEWTQGETDTLIREWNRGTKVPTIMMLTGKTRRQVYSKQHYLMLPVRRGVMPRRIKVDVWMYEDAAKRIDEIASSLGMRRSTYIAKMLEARFRRQDKLPVASLSPPALPGGNSHAHLPRPPHQDAPRFG